MRMLELPCEIDDLVYEVFFDEELKRAVMVPPHKVEDVSVYSILIGGDWTSRPEIGKTLFFEAEEAVKALTLIHIFEPTRQEAIAYAVFCWE